MPHVVLDFSGEVNYKAAHKNRVWVECMRRGKVLTEFERTRTHTARERKHRSTSVVLWKSGWGWQSCLSLTPPSLSLFTTYRLLYTLFFFLRQISFQKCLLMTFLLLVLSLWLSLFVSLFLPSYSSLSLSLSSSFFVCFQFVATAGLPSLSILKQLPSALWDIRTFVGVCVCYMAKSIWTPLVSGCFSWLGLDRLVSIQGRMLLYSYLIIQWLKYHNSAYTLQSQRDMIMFQHFQECVQHNWDSCFCQ